MTMTTAQRIVASAKTYRFRVSAALAHAPGIKAEGAYRQRWTFADGSVLDVDTGFCGVWLPADPSR